MRMVLAIRLFEFRRRKDICSMYAKLLRCTVYACEAALAMGKTPRIGGNPKNQPISEQDIFSKRQALSRAVVVNSNISRGKYLAREGPGSRLDLDALDRAFFFEHRVLRAVCLNWYKPVLAYPIVMGTAKWRLWRYNLKILARRREGERGSDLNDTNIAWPAGGRCGRRGEGEADFFPTLSFFRVCPSAIFASKLSVQLLRGTENTSRYVDRCGYQQKNNLCSKMPPTANLRIFLHKPIAGSLTWTAFPAGGFRSFRLQRFGKNKR